MMYKMYIACMLGQLSGNDWAVKTESRRKGSVSELPLYKRSARPSCPSNDVKHTHTHPHTHTHTSAQFQTLHPHPCTGIRNSRICNPHTHIYILTHMIAPQITNTHRHTHTHDTYTLYPHPPTHTRTSITPHMSSPHTCTLTHTPHTPTHAHFMALL